MNGVGAILDEGQVGGIKAAQKWIDQVLQVMSAGPKILITFLELFCAPP